MFRHLIWLTSLEVPAAERPHPQPLAGVRWGSAILDLYIQSRDEPRVKEELGYVTARFLSVLNVLPETITLETA